MADRDEQLTAGTPSARKNRPGHVLEVFLAFLGLGLTSFGGPVAHLGYFRDAFVVRREWIDEDSYADLMALCQFLPGPASSQVGMAIGDLRAGRLGALAAWVGFTLPSAALLYVVALGADLWKGPFATGILHGLKLAALAVVAQAVWLMAKRLTPDWPRRLLAVVAAAAVLLLSSSWVPVAVIAIAGTLGATLAQPQPAPPIGEQWRHGSLGWLAAFFALLIGLPLLAAVSGNSWFDVFDRFYRTGALVFGGGHVVLPLLQHELVSTGLVDPNLFLAGYGAAQAVPGPLFSFALYAGTILKASPSGLAGGLLALVAIYLPSFLLLFGCLPYWHRLKTIPRLRAALDMANAAVVGLLLAALITPVFTSAVTSVLDVVIAVLALAALFLKAPPWLVVTGTGAVGAGLAAFGLL